MIFPATFGSEDKQGTSGVPRNKLIVDMNILAHRANHNGRNVLTENSLVATELCLQRGWGIETDIRRTKDGTFYISHDPLDDCEEKYADPYLSLFQMYPASIIALNIKELGYERELIGYLVANNVVQQTFLFDMELIEPCAGETAKRIRSFNPQIRLAARVSDRSESIERALAIDVAEVIWLDEFDHLWLTERDIQKLKLAGKTVYAISPEMHGFTLDEARTRWRQFNSWGVDGICTDHAEELAGIFG